MFLKKSRKLFKTNSNQNGSFSPTRPHWAKLVIESPCPCVCLSVCAIGCSFFRGLSSAFRSHDQIPLVNPISPPDRKITQPLKKTHKKYGSGATIRIGQESWCVPYAGFFVRNYTYCILLGFPHFCSIVE